MSGRLLNTKFFVPGPRASTVDRPRIRELFDSGRPGRLVVVSAQAGSGKTTAIADWVHYEGGPDGVVWLSLDDNDAEPRAYWTHVVTALAGRVPELTDAVLPLLQGGAPPLEAVLIELVNQLAESADEVVLVLDDYHLVDRPPIAEGMSFLLGHLPAQVLVVISTRADPNLPLSRWRARGEVVEVRAADLRFTGPEAARYLRRLGLELDPADLLVLEARTEGWAAALQLAALSLRDHPDPGAFIAAFAGDDRLIVDYLVDEVLARQSPETRDFLVHTSVLDRLTGDLCDAVTGLAGGARMLQLLEQQNLFVVPLDSRRQWYRYHHLFADVLRSHLAGSSVGELHARASAWFEQDGQPREAVQHALAAGDEPRAAALVEAAVPELMRRRQESVVADWAHRLPADVVRQRPVLAMGLIAALMAANDLDSVAGRLDELEPWPGALAGPAELYRAALALVAGDLDGTHRHVALVEARAAADDHPTRAGAWGLSGLAYWQVGDLDGLQRCYLQCIAELERAGHISDVLGCCTPLADVRVTQGRLREAEHALRRGLALADAEGGVVRGTADMHRGLADIALERGDIAGAEAELRRAQALGEAAGMPQHPYRLRVTMALLRQARGDDEEALVLLEEAERVYVADFLPDVRPVAAIRARLLIAIGRLDEARAWANEHLVAADDEPSYVREYDHVTLARLLLAEAGDDPASDRLAELSGLLTRLHDASREGGRLGPLVEILVLRSMALSVAGDPTAAADPLRRAVDLGAPEGLVGAFRGHPPELGIALRRMVIGSPAQSGPPDAAYLHSLIEASTRRVRAVDAAPPPANGLVDPLSPRELEVLRLLATDLTGPELARHLVVSLNTLRTHTRNVFTKLGVSGRRAAVSRAGELGLLDR